MGNYILHNGNLYSADELESEMRDLAECIQNPPIISSIKNK